MSMTTLNQRYPEQSGLLEVVHMFIVAHSEIARNNWSNDLKSICFKELNCYK